MTDKYVPQDHMALWWLGNPAQPRPVGELGTIGNRGNLVALFQQRQLHRDLEIARRAVQHFGQLQLPRVQV